MLIPVVAAIVGAAAGQLINYGFRKWRQRNQAVDEWYEETLSLISRGYGICLSARKRSNLNYGSISEESKKISQELQAQINPYPDKVDEEAVEQVKGLAEVFRKLSAVTEVTEEKSTIESVNELFDMGQREYSSTDLDLGETVNTSTDYSPLMQKLLKEINQNPRIFGSQVGNNFEESDSMEELLSAMKSQFGGEKAIEKAIESNVVTDEWDETLSLGVRVHLQISTNLCEEAINHISDVNNMNTAN